MSAAPAPMAAPYPTSAPKLGPPQLPKYWQSISCPIPTVAPAPAPMAPAMAAPFKASFALLPQPFRVPSESFALLAQGLPWASSSEPFSRNSSPFSVVMSSNTIRIWPTPLTRFAGLTKTTWPSTRLPTGTIVLPSETTGCSTYPVNLSPVLLVLDVSVVCSLTCNDVPAGSTIPLNLLLVLASLLGAGRAVPRVRTGGLSELPEFAELVCAAREMQGRAAARRRPVTSFRFAVFMAIPPTNCTSELDSRTDSTRIRTSDF